MPVAKKAKPRAVEQWTADAIKGLLSVRHSEDVFVTECKSGPTTSGYVRLDAWAMPRSWANPATYGYEIKVSRSDWGRDNKWQSYLPLCNQLYIVCPRGLIAKDEVPDPLGLIHAVRGEKSERLHTVKRAAVRDVPLPEDLARYILMWRAAVQRSPYARAENDRFENAAAWESWLNSRKDLASLGARCSKEVSRLIQEHHRQRYATNDDNSEAASRLRLVEIALRSGGVHMHHYDEAELKSLTSALSAHKEQRELVRLASDLEGIGKRIQWVADALKTKGA